MICGALDTQMLLKKGFASANAGDRER